MGRALTGSVRPYRGKWRAAVGREYLGLYDDRAEAWDVVNAWLRAESGKVADSLRAYGDAWIAAREVDGHVRGIQQEQSVWRAHICNAPFADYPLRRITPKAIHAWMTTLSKSKARITTTGKGGTAYRNAERTLSRQTLSHVLRVLRSVLDQACIDGKLTSNPARIVRVPKVSRVVEDSDAWAWMTLDEIARVLALPELSGHDARSCWRRAVFAVAIYCGLREGEIWGLRWQDVDLDGKRPCIRVRRSFGGAVKTQRSRRDVPLWGAALDALRAWQRHGGVTRATGLAFPAPHGGCYGKGYVAGWTDHRQRYDGELVVRPGLRSKAGVRPHVRFHDLRHTFCSHLVMGSWGRAWTLPEVRDLAGHSSVSVTERYARLAPGGLHDRMAEMAAARKKDG